MTALTGNDIVVVPIRSGLGLRLGANLGYLRFHGTPDLEPVLIIETIVRRAKYGVP
jgi:hypothetical protein